jgi:hypothetical protein
MTKAALYGNHSAPDDAGKKFQLAGVWKDEGGRMKDEREA